MNWVGRVKSKSKETLTSTLLPPGGAQGFCPSFQRKRNSEVNLKQIGDFIATLVLQILVEEESHYKRKWAEKIFSRQSSLGTLSFVYIL